MSNTTDNPPNAEASAAQHEIETLRRWGRERNDELQQEIARLTAERDAAFAGRDLALDGYALEHEECEAAQEERDIARAQLGALTTQLEGAVIIEQEALAERDQARRVIAELRKMADETRYTPPSMSTAGILAEAERRAAGPNSSGGGA